MPDTIKDGTGTGKEAGVNKQNELTVISAERPLFARVSETQSLSYEFHPPSRGLIAASSYMPYLWMKNISADKNFHVEYIRFGWSGGDTPARSATMSFRMFRNQGQPTANNTTGSFGVGAGPHNLNLSSEREPEMELEFWDGVGSVGMIIADLGDQINCGPVGKGSEYITYHGALILPPSEVLGVSLKGGEDGSGIAVLAGYYKTVGD